MSNVVWKVEPRKAAGKGGARKSRAIGIVPAVAYGKDLDSVALGIPLKTVEDLIHSSNWAQALISLEADALPQLAGKTFMIAELQRHHYKGTPLAVDLRSIRLDQAIRVQVPLEFINTMKIKSLGGVLEVLHRSIEVKCLPTAIPAKIVVDAGEMGLGNTLHMSDITLPEGAESDLAMDYPLCTVVVPRTIEEEKAAEEAAAAALAPPVEGEEAAEGAEPAEGEAEKDKDKDKEGKKDKDKDKDKEAKKEPKKEEGKKEKGK